MRKIFSSLSGVLLAGVLAAPLASQANNLRVTAVATDPSQAAFGHTHITMTVSWENSWRDSVNWDAAWLFVKYRDLSATSDRQWHTATLATADASHQVPAGTALNAAADGKGVFVYRNGAGSGPFTATGVHLDWNWLADNVTQTATGQTNCEFRVFGVEMIYVPQRAFNLNAVESPRLTNEFVTVTSGMNTSISRITSEAALPLGAIRWRDSTGAGGMGNVVTVGGKIYPGSAALPTAYPKGYAAAYCMKYETTQGQYTDFLNSLTRVQQNHRVSVDITGDAPPGGLIYVMADAADSAAAFRNTIVCPLSGMGTTAPVVFHCSRPDRAANFLIWADGAAYLDWAGLRPMSELEFEKIARGPLAALPHDHAWGADTAIAAVNIIGNENGTETTSPTANAVFGFQNFVGGDGGNGPLRAGIFARATTTRAQAGASYYGVMELSGNCWERCVTVAQFDGTSPTNAALFERSRHGNGDLDSLGNHDVLNWPNSTDVLGSCFRGGNWSRPSEWAMTSDRQYGGQAIAGRTSHRSIRGVRSNSSLSSLPHGTGGNTMSQTKYHGGAYDGYEGTPAQPAVLVPTGLRADLSARRVSASPNPATEVVTLALADGAPLRSATLTLTDALGRPVRRLCDLRGTEWQIPCTGLAPGVYFYHLTEGTAPVAAGRVVVR